MLRLLGGGGGGSNYYVLIRSRVMSFIQGYTKINAFNWSKVRKLSFKRKRFLIKLRGDPAVSSAPSSSSLPIPPSSNLPCPPAERPPRHAGVRHGQPGLLQGLLEDLRGAPRLLPALRGAQGQAQGRPVHQGLVLPVQVRRGRQGGERGRAAFCVVPHSFVPLFLPPQRSDPEADHGLREGLGAQESPVRKVPRSLHFGAMRSYVCFSRICWV